MEGRIYEKTIGDKEVVLSEVDEKVFIVYVDKLYSNGDAEMIWESRPMRQFKRAEAQYERTLQDVRSGRLNNKENLIPYRKTKEQKDYMDIRLNSWKVVKF